jgi:ubiquinone/menaquinone biosynthesis C-methylase UbiE/tetratricopeptide (TPR) repeat protein
VAYGSIIPFMLFTNHKTDEQRFNAVKIVREEEKELSEIFDFYTDIYEEYGIQRPELPLIEFKKIQKDEQYEVCIQDERLKVVFDLQKISSEEELRDLYWLAIESLFFKHIAEVYDKQAVIVKVQTPRSYLDAMEREYIRRCEINRDEDVLDVGTLYGDMTSLASKKTEGRIYGLDISKKSLEIAKSKYGERVNFITGNALHLPFSDNSVDVIISNYTFTTIPKRLRKPALREIYRVVKDRVCIWEYTEERFDSYEGNPRAWKIEEWERNLEEVGFKDIEIEEIMDDYGFPVAYFIKAKKNHSQQAEEVNFSEEEKRAEKVALEVLKKKGFPHFSVETIKEISQKVEELKGIMGMAINPCTGQMVLFNDNRIEMPTVYCTVYEIKEEGAENLWVRNIIPIMGEIYHDDGNPFTDEELEKVGLRKVKDADGNPVRLLAFVSGGRVVSLPGPWVVPYMKTEEGVVVLKRLEEISDLAGREISYEELKEVLLELVKVGKINLKLASDLQFKGSGCFKEFTPPGSSEALMALRGQPVYTPELSIQKGTGRKLLAGGCVGGVDELTVSKLELEESLRRRGAVFLEDSVWPWKLFDEEKLPKIESQTYKEVWILMRLSYNTLRLDSYLLQGKRSGGISVSLNNLKQIAVQLFETEDEEAMELFLRLLYKILAKNLRACISDRIYMGNPANQPLNYGPLLEIADPEGLTSANEQRFIEMWGRVIMWLDSICKQICDPKGEKDWEERKRLSLKHPFFFEIFLPELFGVKHHDKAKKYFQNLGKKLEPENLLDHILKFQNRCSSPLERIEVNLSHHFKKDIYNTAKLLLPYRNILSAINILLFCKEIENVDKVVINLTESYGVKLEKNVLEISCPRQAKIVEILETVESNLGFNIKEALEDINAKAPYLLISPDDFKAINIILPQRMAGLGDLVFVANAGQVLRQIFPDKEIRIIFYNLGDFKLACRIKLLKGLNPQASDQNVEGLRFIDLLRYFKKRHPEEPENPFILEKQLWYKAQKEIIGKEDVSIVYALGPTIEEINSERLKRQCGEAKVKIYVYELGFKSPFQNPLQVGDAHLGFGEDEIGLPPVSPVTSKIYSQRYSKSKEEILEERRRILQKFTNWQLLNEILKQDNLIRSINSKWGFLYCHIPQTVEAYFRIFENVRNHPKYAPVDTIFFIMCGWQDRQLQEKVKDISLNNDYNLFIYDDREKKLICKNVSQNNNVSIILDYSIPRKLFNELLLHSDDLPTVVSGQDNLANILHLNLLSSGRPFFWEVLNFQILAEYDLIDFIRKRLGNEEANFLDKLWDLHSLTPEQEEMFLAFPKYCEFFKKIAQVLDEHPNFISHIYYLILTQLFQNKSSLFDLTKYSSCSSPISGGNISEEMRILEVLASEPLLPSQIAEKSGLSEEEVDSILERLLRKRRVEKWKNSDKLIVSKIEDIFNIFCTKTEDEELTEKERKDFEKVLEERLKIIPRSALTRAALYTLRVNLLKFKKASWCLEDIKKLNKDPVELLIKIFNLYRKGRKFKEILECCKNMDEDLSKDPRIKILKAEILYIQGEYEKVLKYLKEAVEDLKDNPKSIHRLCKIIKILIKIKNYEEVISVCKEVLKFKPKDYKVKNQMSFCFIRLAGKSLLVKGKMDEEAEKNISEAKNCIKEVIKHGEPLQKQSAFNHQSYLNLITARFYHRCAKFSHQQANLQESLSFYRKSLSSYKKAIECALKVLKLNLNNKRAQSNLNLAKTEKKKIMAEKKEVIKELKKKEIEEKKGGVKEME